jgi:hypothetical protein
MLDLRELAFIELRVLGRTIALAEYALGSLLLCGIGLLGLVRSHGHSLWMWYMVSIGVNYLALLWFTILIMPRYAQDVEPADRGSMSRLRRQQFWLLVPFAGLWTVIVSPKQKSSG